MIPSIPLKPLTLDFRDDPQRVFFAILQGFLPAAAMAEVNVVFALAFYLDTFHNDCGTLFNLCPPPPLPPFFLP